jgi:hypothetical protein
MRAPKEFLRKKNHCLNKKGYFFVVDAIIAITIVLLGMFLLFSTGSRSFDQDQPLQTLEDFTTIATAQTLSESTNAYYVNTLLPARVVPLSDMTPTEEIGYLLLKYNETGNVTYLNYASNFTASLFNESIEDRYGASLSINDTIIYSRPVAATSFNIARTTVLYVRMNETTLRGPVLSEVRLWN